MKEAAYRDTDHYPRMVNKVKWCACVRVPDE